MDLQLTVKNLPSRLTNHKVLTMSCDNIINANCTAATDNY
jgi:hypothetical protein